jgi:L-asparaginase/Glu-tRNA(Gln) amidotransferase subunit D
MYKARIHNEKIGSICFHEQVHAGKENKLAVVENDERKVLIVHTGGTIGMFKD